jgi:hypothetical protein
VKIFIFCTLVNKEMPLCFWTHRLCEYDARFTKKTHPCNWLFFYHLKLLTVRHSTLLPLQLLNQPPSTEPTSNPIFYLRLSFGLKTERKKLEQTQKSESGYKVEFLKKCVDCKNSRFAL